MSKGQPRTYFKADSVAKLREITGIPIIPISKYKLSKGKRPIIK